MCVTVLLVLGETTVRCVFLERRCHGFLPKHQACVNTVLLMLRSAIRKGSGDSHMCRHVFQIFHPSNVGCGRCDAVGRGRYSVHGRTSFGLASLSSWEANRITSGPKGVLFLFPY
jgi:hypothetical protein